MGRASALLTRCLPEIDFRPSRPAPAAFPGITTIPAANRYLFERFVPQHNATFARAARGPVD
jgi:hypothetical protein